MNEIIIDDKPYDSHYKEESRHLSEGTAQITYRPWNDFDVIEIFAVSPHALKSVKLGYGFWGDYPIHDKYVEKTHSVSTSITAKVPKDGIKITILSYNEAINKAKEINWTKVKIEK